MITVSAPGKIHLLGEHAVVYGRPALLASIDKRIYVKIKNQRSKIKDKDNIVIHCSEKDDLVRKATEVFKRAFSIKDLPPLEITINSQLPTGSGLGSSAAVAAATIGALMKFIKNLWNPTHINELAFEVEKIAHGNPSGADNTTIVFGGLVWYRREFDFLKSIWSLPKSSYKIPPFVFLDSGRPEESTREMVENVAKLYKKREKSIEEIFNDQEKQTKKLLLSLRNNNRDQLIEAIKTGEKNLEKMEIVGDFAKKIIRKIEALGGTAKICGGGGRKVGSGIILCYHKNLSIIKNIAMEYNVSLFQTELGGEGVRLEKS